MRVKGHGCGTIVVNGGQHGCRRRRSDAERVRVVNYGGEVIEIIVIVVATIGPRIEIIRISLFVLKVEKMIVLSWLLPAPCLLPERDGVEPCSIVSALALPAASDHVLGVVGKVAGAVGGPAEGERKEKANEGWSRVETGCVHLLFFVLMSWQFGAKVKQIGCAYMYPSYAQCPSPPGIKARIASIVRSARLPRCGSDELK